MINNQVLIAVFVLIIILLIIVFSLFMNLVFKRKSEVRFKKKVKQYLQQNYQNWYDYLILGKAFKVSHLEKSDLYAIDQIFVTYAMTVKEKEVKKRISTFAAINMHHYYLNQLRSKTTAEHLNILHRILMLEFDFLLPEVKSMLDSGKFKNVDCKVLAMCILAKFDSDIFLKNIAEDNKDFREYEYLLIVSQIDESYFDHFIHHFDQLPRELKLALLDHLSYSSNLDRKYLEFYEANLNVEDHELRLKVLKAIAAFGFITEFSKYEHFSTSSIWEEKLMIARILTFVDSPQSYKILKALVKDSVWQVRKQAASSLRRMRLGEKILQEVIEENDDVYAADISKEILIVG